MTAKKVKTCEACQQLFRGRANAKTCSAKCRKRLQRAKEFIAAEAETAENIAVHVVKNIAHEIEPSYASQEGFIGSAAPANNFQPKAPVSFLSQNIEPQEKKPVQPAAEINPPMASTPSDAVSQPVTVVHNHYAPVEKPFRRHILEATALLLAIVIVGAVFSFFSNRANQANLKNQSATIQQLASSLNTNNFVQNPSEQSKLNLNLDTVVSDGKKLTATGPVVIQNENNSSRAFSIQNAAGNNLLIADTQHQKIGIGAAPASSGAILQVAGDISANNIAAAGDVTSNSGRNSLNNNGLTINSVLVCTANGCSSSVPIPTISSAVANLNVANVAFINKGQTFVGDNTFTGQTTFKAISTKAFQIQNSTGTDNIFYVDTNNNRIGIGTIPINGGAALQVAGSIDLSTGSYQVGGTSGASLSCPAGQLLQQAIIQGGIVTSGSCVAVAGATTPSLQQVYDASTPAKIGLSSASGQFQIQDSATPLGTNLFSITNNGASTTYFAVNNLGISVTGNVNTTGQYQINGTQIASTDLGDSANLARLDGTQTFTGANTFNNAANSFTGDGSGLTGVDASKLNGQASSFYTDAGSLSTGTLSDSRLSANVTKAGNTFNGASQLVQLTSGGILPVLSGANLTSLSAGNISSGTLNDARLSSNVALLSANNTFTGDDSFHLSSSALTVQDASTPLGTDLFEITDSTSTTKYLAVSASGVKVGAYDVCTTAGNCAGVGGGVTTAGGTTNQLAKFTASSGIGNSIISDDGSTATIAGDLAANNITQNGNAVCDVSGNCTGVSGGSIGGSGTAGKISLFTGSGYTIGDSILTQASTTVTAAGSINVTGAYELNGTQVDSTILSNDGNLAKLNGTQTFTGANTFSSASNSFTGDGSGLTGLNAANILTGTLADARLDTDVVFTGASQTFSGINNFSNASNSFTGDGSGLTALDASNISTGQLSDSRLSNNVALLSGTGPQTFTGNNKFTGTLLSNVTNANALEIQNSGGSSTLFNADTSAMRIAIGQATASYTLDVAGDINTSGAFRVGGSQGTGITCTSGNVIQNPIVVGGIITGGTCVANGGGVTTTLQDAYNNSSSPALITTSSASKGILLKAGTGDDSTNLLQVQNANGNNMFNVDSTTSSTTIGGATTSSTALQVQNSSAQNILDVDTASNQVNIGTLSTPGTIIAQQAGSAPTVTPTGTTGATNYSYEVTAVSTNGAETLASTAGTTTTGNATLSSANYNAITWSTIANTAFYRIYRTAGGSTQGLIGATTSNSGSFKDYGFTAGGLTPSLASSGSLLTSTTYYYKVTALDATGGQTLASAETSITTSSSYNTVTLSWAPVAGARSYRLYRGTSTGAENTYYLTTTNSYIDTGAAGTGGSLPSVSTGYLNNLTNSSSATITVNNDGSAVGNIYVGVGASTTPLSTLSGVPVNVFSTLQPLEVQGSYAYTVTGTYPNNKLAIIDISNPLNPVTVGSVGTMFGIYKIVISGNYAYLTTGNSTRTMQVINISNKSNPQLVATYNGAFNPFSYVTSQGQYLYGVDNSGNLTILDLSNPTNVVSLSRLSLGASQTYELAISGSYLYAVSTVGGYVVVDVSNPSAPVIAYSVSSSTSSIVATNSLTNASGLFVSGSYMYIASNGRLSIYSISNPATPTLVGYDSSVGDISNVTVAGRYAYISGRVGWEVEDVSSPAHPYSVAAYNKAGSYTNVAVEGRYLYDADGGNSLFSTFDLGGAYTQNFQAGNAQVGSLQVDSNEVINGSANIQGALGVGQGLQVSGNVGLGGNLETSGMLSGTSMGAPQIGAIQVNGTLGTASYSYEVTAINANGTTLPSAAGTTSIGNATLSSSNYIRINWSPVIGATGYNIYRTASGGSPPSTGYIGSTTSTPFTDTGIVASGSVPTVDTSGNLKVAGGFQIQNSSGTALLTSDTNNMRINIDSTYSAMSVSGVGLSNLDAPGAPTVTATGTTGTKTYAYKIAAVTSQGLVSVASSSGSTTSGNTTLSATNYNAISWTAVSGANSYSIYRTSSNGSPSSLGLIGTTTSTSFNDTGFSVIGTTPTATGLTNGVRYYYQITAIDAAGGETLPTTEISTLVSTTSRSLIVNWTPVPGAQGYRVYRGTAAGGETGYFSVANDYFIDNGGTQSNTTATPPTKNTASAISSTSSSNLQLSVGGLGTAGGQVYISGVLPTSPIATTPAASNVYSLGNFGHYVFGQDSSGTLQVVDVSSPTGPATVASVSTGTYNSVASGRYIYTEGAHSFKVYDTSNSNNPALVGSTGMTTSNGSVRDSMTVVGKYVYVVTSGINNNDILQIVDVSNPATPRLISNLSLGITDSGSPSLSMVVAGHYAYIAGKSSGTLTAVDVSNPANPIIIDTLSGFLNPANLVVQGHFLYFTFGSGAMFLYVMDISNPYAFYHVSNVGISQFPLSSAVAGHYLYIGNSIGAGSINVIDISNPYAPVLDGSISNVPATQLLVSGRYLYAVASNQLQVFDMGGELTQQLEAGIADIGSLQVDSNAQIGGDTSLTGSLNVGHSAQVAGSLGVGGGAVLQGGVVIGGGSNQLNAPGAPTVTPTGTTGSTTYSYVVTALNAYGGETVASGVGTTTSGNLTLTSINYNAISWSSVSGAISYNVYRTAGGSNQGLIGTTTATSLNDTSSISASPTATAPTTDTTGQLTVQGSTLFKNATDSTKALQIQNSSGTTLLAADTTNMKIAITGDLNVSGNVEVGGYLITDGGMYATSLPGSPVNGQEVYYDADPTNGVVWHLRYNSTSSYWEYLGGSSFYAAVETSETAPASWGDMATVGPSVTIPLAGDYVVSYSAYVSDEASAGSASAGVAVNGTEDASTTSGLGMNSGDVSFGQLASTTRLTLSASDVVKLVYQASGTSSLQYRHLTITPVRVQ